MSATVSIITRRIGEGGDMHGLAVRRVQQLLRLTHKPVNVTGIWDARTARYLNDIREEPYKKDPSVWILDDPATAFKAKNFLTPTDPVLFELALAAGVLIRLGVGWFRGADAFLDVHRWLEKHGATFDWGRAVWGLQGFPSWGIVTLTSETGRYEFPMNAPLALNCTLYANLMMSVWAQGNAHKSPFSASIANSGGSNHLATSRYGYPNLGLVTDVASVRQKMKHPERLYCLEATSPWSADLTVSHMGLLYQNTVYECNVSPKMGVQSNSLATWLARHTPAWLLGPSRS